MCILWHVLYFNHSFILHYSGFQILSDVHKIFLCVLSKLRLLMSACQQVEMLAQKSERPITAFDGCWQLFVCFPLEKLSSPSFTVCGFCLEVCSSVLLVSAAIVAVCSGLPFMSTLRFFMYKLDFHFSIWF